jgi:hypothetical protein
MTTFGKRTLYAPPAPAAITAPADVSHGPWKASRLIVMTVFAVLAALVAVHFWINILRVPWVRPVGALFGAGPATQQGWAAWYVSPLFAAALTLAMLAFYFRRPQRWTLLALAAAGIFAVVFGAWAAHWVKNIGYTWYFAPGASIVKILSVQPPMAVTALGRAMQVLMQVPLLVAIGAAAGAVAALMLRLPLYAAAGGPAVGGQAQAATPQIAGWPARLCTAVLIGLLAGAVASFGVPSIGVVVAAIAGLIWFFVSFRDGQYVFVSVLIGSAAIAVLTGLPFALVTMQPSFGGFGGGLGRIGGAGGGFGSGFDWKLLVFGALLRLPVLVLLSVGLIKAALLMSRTTADALRRMVPPS